MDGTLYDEFEFISQAYGNVAEEMFVESGISKNILYAKLCEEWLNSGSSRTDLFQHVYETCTGIKMNHELLRKCIKAFRISKFDLCLPYRTQMILDNLTKKNKFLFIITDGNSELQRKKMRSLRLDQWFFDKNIYITGDYGAECYKPDLKILDYIEPQIRVKKCIYLGDRNVDREFAERAGFDFMYVKVMNLCE
jgi:putative hydrolase of the HAD superfamily